MNGQGYIPARETALAAATASLRRRGCGHPASHRRPIRVTLVGGGLGKAGSEIRGATSWLSPATGTPLPGIGKRALESDPASHAAMHNLALGARKVTATMRAACELLGRAIEIKPKQQYLEISRDIDDRERQYRFAMLNTSTDQSPSAAKLEPTCRRGPAARRPRRVQALTPASMEVE